MSTKVLYSRVRACLKSTSSFSKARYKNFVTRMETSPAEECKKSTITNGGGFTNGSLPVHGYRKTYEDAVQALNDLQSNAEIVKIIAANRNALKHDSLPGTRKYLLRTGITLEDLDTLNVIHVAGTKGKGSTCAYVESILRHAGLKTGFYSSPHLISVRERIRLNGKPLTHAQFTHHFFEIYDKLYNQMEHENDMPYYFRILTCMAFNVFLKENVDVAVLEVGVGGLYDSTNIVRNPVVVGVTSLGLDHQPILGDTIEEIAMEKAGIMKWDTPAFTVPNNIPSVQNVLQNCANQMKCPLFRAPPLELYERCEQVDFGLKDPVVSKINATLAIQLSNTFLAKKFPEKLHYNRDNNLGKPFMLQNWHLEGLNRTKWPGRFEKIQRNKNLAYFLDGAHTLESFVASIRWFKSSMDRNCTSVLVFHLTGLRMAETLLEPFIVADIFDKVVFCPIVASLVSSPSADNWSKVESQSDLRSRCESHADAWKNIQQTLNVSSRRSEIQVFDSIEQVVNAADDWSRGEDVQGENYKPVNVFVTGSLHLVGTFLSILDPDVCDR